MTDYPQYMIQETVLSIRMSSTKLRFGTTGNRRFPESCNTSATAKRPFALLKCIYFRNFSYRKSPQQHPNMAKMILTFLLRFAFLLPLLS